jgi:hypothetical protein
MCEFWRSDEVFQCVLFACNIAEFSVCPDESCKKSDFCFFVCNLPELLSDARVAIDDSGNGILHNLFNCCSQRFISVVHGCALPFYQNMS